MATLSWSSTTSTGGAARAPRRPRRAGQGGPGEEPVGGGEGPAAEGLVEEPVEALQLGQRAAIAGDREHDAPSSFLQYLLTLSARRRLAAASDRPLSNQRARRRSGHSLSYRQ